MVKPLPARFNPEQLAVGADRFEARVPQEQFPRLRELLASDQSEVLVKLSFSNRKDHIAVKGRWQTRFAMECQRCISPLGLSFDEPFELIFVVNEAAANALPEELDPVILDEHGQMGVVEMLEDELLLHLPSFPRHADLSKCVSGDAEFGNVEDAIEAARSRPFDVLKDLKVH